MELTDSEMGDDRRRYYWVTERGKSMIENIIGLNDANEKMISADGMKPQ